MYLKKTITSLVIALILILFILPIANDVSYLSYNAPYDDGSNYRTGDILFYRYHGDSVVYHDANKNIVSNFANIFKLSAETLVSKIISGVYTHVAMIIVINNRPYIYDTPGGIDSYSIKMYDILTKKIGLFRHPILLDISYINKYIGDVYRIKYIGADIPLDVIVKTIRKKKNIQINPYKCVNKCMQYDKTPYTDSLTCVSFNITVCNEFGILALKNYNCTTPIVFYRLLMNSNKYDNVIYKYPNHILI